MSLPEIVSRAEWTRARVALLEQEKELTKARDELSAPLGRQEDWEERKGRAESLGPRADQAGAGATSGRG